MRPAVRTGVLVLAVAWGAIIACLLIIHQFEPSPTAPASSSPPALWVELDANIAAQSPPPPGDWAAPTDNNSKGKP